MPVSEGSPLQSQSNRANNDNSTDLGQVQSSFGGVVNDNSAVGGNNENQFQRSFEKGERDDSTDDSHVLRSGTVTADIESDDVCKF